MKLHEVVPLYESIISTLPTGWSQDPDLKPIYYGALYYDQERSRCPSLTGDTAASIIL
jgi:hypothetical protein